MTTFIESRTDPFVERREAIVQDVRQNGRTQTPVRRPVRGIEVKESTYGVIRVALSSGGFLPVIDAAGDIVTSRDGVAMTTQYTNFLIQAVQEDRREKQQIVETFGDAYIFFFGEAPRLLNVQGLLLNTADFNWRAEWWENYERYFRGTRCVEHGARIFLFYDDIIAEGYILSASASDNAAQPEVIPLNFQMFVTGYINSSLIGDPDFPRPSGDIDYSEPASYDQALRQYEQGRNIQRELSIDSVRQANVKAYQQAQIFGSGRMLVDAIRDGLTSGDPSISGFLSRVSTALQRTQSFVGAIDSAVDSNRSTTNSAAGSLTRPNPFTTGREGRPLRGTFRDNTDEFIGGQEPDARSLASPLSMADRWLQADQAVDSMLTDFGVNPTDMGIYDMMGRAGRADSEIAGREGPRRLTGGIFQTGATRALRSGVVRDVPFGIGAFMEDV